MANKNIITNGSKISQIELLYYSPVSLLPNSTRPLGTIYAFLSKVDPWADEDNPDTPTASVKDLKRVFKTMFVVKKVKTSDLSPVIRRYDWTSGTTYEFYQDNLDMTSQDENGNLVYKFYVKNKYDQVFKCLWNNNEQPSTVEPYFEPGTYSSNGIFKGADGYKWKFMYTVDVGDKVKFMDSTWLPISVTKNNRNPLISNFGSGSIDVINVLNGGSGYDPANAIVSVVVTGDGSGFSASANVVSGSIQDIIVNTPGKNYTYANVSIQSSKGSNASVIGPTSPIGGHAFDPISELGCNHIMYSIEFSGSENGVIPTDIDYHQLGLIVNPTTTSTNPNPATEAIYSTTTDFVVAAGADNGFIQDETIYQGDPSNPTFFGTVLNFDTQTNVVKVINMTGTPTTSGAIHGLNSSVTRTLLSYNAPNFTILSGYITYLENRTGIARSVDGVEQIRLVLGY